MADLNAPSLSLMDGSSYNQATGAQVAAPTMTVDSLKPATPLNIPQGTPTPPPSTASVDITQKGLQDTITNLTPAPTAADTQSQALLDSLASLTGQDAGKFQASAQAKIDAGIPDIQKTLTDLNGQITTGNAEYKQMQDEFQNMQAGLGANGGVTSPGILAAQNAGLTKAYSAKLSAKASDLALLSAKAQAAQGNYQTALTIASNAVDAKYGPIEDQIKVKQAQLNALTPTLNKEEKVQALAQQKLLTDQAQKVADEKAASKENVSLAMIAGVSTKYVNKNGEFFDANSGKPFTNPKDFFAAAGVSSFEEAYQKGLVTDVTPAKLQDIQTVQQIMAKYPDAGVKPTDTLDQAAAKLKNSEIYRKETYIAPVARSGAGSGGNAGGFSGGTNPVTKETISGEDVTNFWAQAASSGVNLNSLLPSLGMGAAAVADKKALLNKMATNAMTLGIDGGQFGAILTDSRAKQKTYSTLQQQGTLLATNEDKATKDFELVKSLGAKMDKNSLSTAVPIIDSWLRTGQVQVSNNADVNNYIGALTTSLTAYSKVVGGQTTGSGVTEGINNEVQNLIGKGLSTSAVNSYIDSVAKPEMGNTVSSYNKSLKDLFGSIDQANTTSDNSGGLSTNSNSSPYSVQAPDGKTYNFNSQVDLDKFKKDAGL